MRHCTSRAGLVLAVVTLFAAMLIALAGCAAETATVTESDDGGSVTVDLDGTLEVSLEANPSTGFGWVVVDDAGGILRQVGEPSFEEGTSDSKSGAEVVGASGRQVFRFDAANDGTGELKMEYKRSWETTVPAEKTFSLDVTVE